MDTSTALSNVGWSLVSGIVVSLRRSNRVATGKTISEIEVVTEGATRMMVYAPAYIISLQLGRKPTSATGPYMKRGGLSFKDSLRLWMEARGIPEGKKSKNAVYGPVLWAIYTKINQDGYTGTQGVLSDPLSDKNLSQALDNNLGPLANLYASQVLEDLFK